MASLSLPSIPGWGKPASRLPGARDPPRSLGHGLRVWLVGARPTVLQTCSRALHHVSTVPSTCLACGRSPMGLSLEGLSARATILTTPHQRRRHGNTHACSWAHLGQGAAPR